MEEKTLKTLYSQAEMQKESENFLKTLMQKEGATVLGLKGDLGAGKTTFTQSLARACGITETLTSPTFVIQKTYKIPQPATFSSLIHIDAYRLESSDELLHLGFQELLQDPNNLICIEWPENVTEALPEDIKYLSFSFINEKTRTLSYE